MDRGPDDPSPRSIAHYRIDATIGRGGMGEVYKAWDERLHRTVAIKGLLAAPDVSSARERFIRETRVACRVTHPYVATVYDVIEEGGAVYMVMEFIEGRSLEDLLAGPEADAVRGRLPELALEIAEALAAVHAAGLIHRDLKPSNVMVTASGHVKVVDFGVARAMDGGVEQATRTSLTGQGLVIGTLPYMSPEQLRGMPLDARSDLFSLGIVLFEALTGQHPFLHDSPVDTSSAILRDPPGDEADLEALTHAGPLGEVVLRLLEKDPASRYASADALVSDLRAVLKGSRLSAMPTASRAAHPTRTAAMEAARAPRRRIWPWAALAVAAIVAVAVWRRDALFGPHRPEAAGRPIVAVLPFKDMTAEPGAQGRGAMIADLLGATLSDATAVRALDAYRVREIAAPLGDDPAPASLVRRFAESAGARWVVTGTIYKPGSGYTGKVAVYDADRPEAAPSTFDVGGASATAFPALIRAKVLDVVSPGVKEREDEAWKNEMKAVPDEARTLESEAREAMRQGRLGDAIDALGKATALAPEFALALARLASAQDAAGYGKAAIASAAKAASLVGMNAGSYSERTRLEAQAIAAQVQGDSRKLVELRDTLAKRHPDEPALHVALSEALRAASRPDEALAAVDRAIAVDPSEPRAQLERAKVLLALKKPASEVAAALDEAGRLYGAVGSSSGAALVMMERARGAYTARDWAAASRDYARAAASFDSAGQEARAAVARKSQADAEIMAGHLETAETLSRSAIEGLMRTGNERDIVSSLTTLGARFLLQGDYAKGEAMLRDALERAQRLDNDALRFDAAYTLASLLDYTGRIGDAAPLAAQAKSIAQSMGNKDYERRAAGLIADCAYQSGDLAGAADTYRSLIALAEQDRDPGRVSVILANLAEVLEAQGALAEALGAVERVLASANAAKDLRGAAHARIRRARIVAQLGLPRAADDDLQAAAGAAESAEIGGEPMRVKVHLARAIAAACAGRWPEVRVEADRALALAAKAPAVSTEAPALTAAGTAALAAGRAPEAEAFARRALAVARVLPHERAAARAMLARALARSGRADEARREAAQALDEASRLGVPVTEALAAAALADVSTSPGDRETLSRRKDAAVKRFLDGIPAGRRESVRARADLKDLFEGGFR